MAMRCPMRRMGSLGGRRGWRSSISLRGLRVRMLRCLLRIILQGLSLEVA